MRRTLVCLLLVSLLLVAAGPLLAANQAPLTPDEIRAKIAEIDAKCAAAVAAIGDLQALKTELLQQLGQKAPPPPAARPSAWADKVSVSAYFQSRYEGFSANTGSQDRFMMRRAYLTILAKPSARSQAVITVGSDGSANIKTTAANWSNLYADYMLGKHDTVRFGQAPAWFGLEVAQSASQRLAFERAAFLQGSDAGKPSGFYAGNRWDRGLWWIHTPPDTTSWMPQTVVSVVNGVFRNDPVISDKTVAVDLKWQPKWGTYGVSWLNGAFQQPVDPTTITTSQPGFKNPTPKGQFIPGWAYNTKFSRDAWLGYIRVQASPKTWALQTEYAAGTLNMYSVRGWYGQAELPLAHTPGTAFAKYEWYNTDTDAPSGAVYDAWILGYAHQLDKNNKLTAQRTWGEIGGAIPNGTTKPGALAETGLQWQYSF
jgi:hypothetical protein